MKPRKKISLIIGLSLLLLILAVFLQRQKIEIPTREIPADLATPESSTSSQPPFTREDTRAVGLGESKEESVRNDQMRAARGSGYLWGNALNGVYATRILSADGQWRLDVTELYRSFKGFVRPVHLEDATASPEARAEYLAAVITGALGLNTAEQPALAGLLQAYYKADPGEGTQQEDQRTRLSNQARETLLAQLSPESQELFQTVFNTPDFLYRSMFVATDEIRYSTGGTGSSVAFASGKARFTFGRDGELKFDAENVHLEGGKAQLRKDSRR